MEPLTGGNEAVRLGDVTLMAPGLKGTARVLAGTRGEVRAAESTTDLLDDLMQRADMRSMRTVEIRAAALPSAATGGQRAGGDDDAMRLDVPDLGEDAEQVVLAVDEAGAMTWHVATDIRQADVDQPAGARASASRSGGPSRRFVIPRRALEVDDAADATHRALLGSLGRKLLKVIVYPVTDVLLGKPARAIAEHWEGEHRAYGLRHFTPANYRLPADPSMALTADSARALTGGRSLLFVHGTFSTAHGAFHDIPPALMQELHTRYDGRVFAFNHFSLSHDPCENVRRFNHMLQQVLPNDTLDVDIVAHSRGGLVARTIADGHDVFGLEESRVRVQRAVFAGVPNQGTALARPDHMMDMIDRFTTALNFLPPGGVADLFEGVLIAVKIAGHGALNALQGLRSMDPDGDFLKALNSPGRRHDGFLAISANYEPRDAGLRGLVGRTANRALDTVFGGDGNDLVVPERGVYDTNGCDSFPIEEARCLRLSTDAGVMHTSMFGHPAVATHLRDWLV
jgi:hypothetical protein